MTATGNGTAHRHKTRGGSWYDQTDVVSGSTHTHDVDLSGYVLKADLDALVIGMAHDINTLEARIAALETPPPVVTPPPVITPVPPTGPVAPAGYRQVFFDDYDRWIARGTWADKSKPKIKGAWQSTDGMYLLNDWKDTNGKGWYDAGQVQISSGYLDGYMFTDAAGLPHVIGFKPRTSVDVYPEGGIAGAFVWEFRARADSMPGMKGVPLGWPVDPTYTGPSDDIKWKGGEIDVVEGNFDKQPAAFLHYKNASPTATYQDWYPYTGISWQDWHTYRVDFRPNTSCEFLVDGVSIGKSTGANVPGNYPMRPNYQFETQLGSVYPDKAVAGHVQLAYTAIWVPAA